MPSLEHEKFVELFVRDPRLAVRLLQSTGRVELPTYEALEVASTDTRELVPATKRADAVVLLRPRGGEPVFALLVEVQLNRDGEKRFAWPFYVSALRARFNCPACLLVFAIDEAVAAWCAQPIELGQPSSAFVPLVVGPELVPVVIAAEQAREAPFLGLLSALAHGKTAHGPAVARAAWAGLGPMPEGERMLWLQVLLTGLDAAARAALDELMNLDKFRSETPFYKEGLSAGLAKGEARSILVVLEARGLDVSDAHREAILAVRDPARLDELLRKALAVASAAELLGD